MLFLTFTAVDRGAEFDNNDRYAFFCPYTGNNLLKTGWNYPKELLYFESNQVNTPVFISENLKDIYIRFLDLSNK
jgi:hypothetical protein